MRIISGEARGRRLIAPAGMDTRPTGDRVRESLFSILGGRVLDAVVLDLFAGSGALAFEAMSRGADRAVLCDSSREAVKVIAKNAEVLWVADRVEILRMDYRSALKRMGDTRFSLVFLDPPYRMGDAYGIALSELRLRNLLSENALVVAEHSADMEIPSPDGWMKVDFRKYRDTAITMFRVL